MENAPSQDRFFAYLDEKNFIAAYTYLKETFSDKQLKTELAGLLVNRIFDELDDPGIRARSERRLYYRSLLLWIFRDFPGLGVIYRGQLGKEKSATDLVSFIKKAATDGITRDDVEAGIEKAFDDLKQNIDDATEQVKTGQAEEKVKDFFSRAEKGIRQGLRQVADVFETLTKPPEDKSGGNKPDGGSD